MSANEMPKATISTTYVDHTSIGRQGSAKPLGVFGGQRRPSNVNRHAADSDFTFFNTKDVPIQLWGVRRLQCQFHVSNRGQKPVREPSCTIFKPT